METVVLEDCQLHSDQVIRLEHVLVMHSALTRGKKVQIFLGGR